MGPARKEAAALRPRRGFRVDHVVRSDDSGDLGQPRLRDVVEADRAGLDLTVAELADDLEDLRPRRVQPLVHLLVGLDGHHELELLDRHLALLGGFAVVAAAAAGAAPPLEPGRGTAVGAGPAL